MKQAVLLLPENARFRELTGYLNKVPFSSRYREICHPIVDLDRKAVAEAVKTFGFMWFAESPDDFRYAFYVRFYEVRSRLCQPRASKNRTACDAWSRLVPQTKFEAVAEVVKLSVLRGLPKVLRAC